jgi:co-chaperonin GroES (HSP10)
MEDSGVSRGGIIIPQVARIKLNQGVVKEKGPLCHADNIKIGEVVIFPQHSEYRIGVDTTEIILIRESDIMCGDNLSTPLPSENIEEIKRTPTGRRAPVGLCPQCACIPCKCSLDFGNNNKDNL